jgi:hypothetical protein
MDTKPRIIGNAADFFRDGEEFTSVTPTASRARAGGVATLVTATPHGLSTGDEVTIAGLGGVGYDLADKVVTVVNATKFTYAAPGADEAVAPDVAGTVTFTGTAGRETRPPETADWIDLGKLEQLEVEPKCESREVYAPNPGHIVLYDVLDTKFAMTFSFTANEVTPVAVEMLYKSAALDSAATTFRPLEGRTKKGWLRIKQYDQDNLLFATVYVYVHLKVSGKVTFGDNVVTVPFEATMLLSGKNSGELTV